MIAVLLISEADQEFLLCFFPALGLPQPGVLHVGVCGPSDGVHLSFGAVHSQSGGDGLGCGAQPPQVHA